MLHTCCLCAIQQAAASALARAEIQAATEQRKKSNQLGHEAVSRVRLLGP